MHRREAEIELRRRSNHDAFARRKIQEVLRSDERHELVDRSLRSRHELAARRMIAKNASPDIERRPRGIDLSRDVGKRGFGLRQLPLADREERLRRQIDQLFGAITRFDGGRSNGELAWRARQNASLQLGRIRFDGASRVGGGGIEGLAPRTIGRGAEDARRIRPQHFRRAVKHRDGTLDENTRRVAQVLARGREEPRHQPELRRGLVPPALDRRRLHRHQVVHAVGDGCGIDHRIARPRADRIEIQDPAVDDPAQDAVVDALVGRQLRGAYRVEP